jgi:hypothetical protein
MYILSEDNLTRFSLYGTWCAIVLLSVADPGSGAFLTPGSGIRIWDEFFTDPGSQIPDTKSF